MLINQDFAHSEHKSPVKRKLKLVSATHRDTKEIIPPLDLNRATRLLNETIIKIDGAYAPSTIRAYKTNFERFISFCEPLSNEPLPSNPATVSRYIEKLTISNLRSSSIRLAIASISAIHKLNYFPDPTQTPEVKLELKRMN